MYPTFSTAGIPAVIELASSQSVWIVATIAAIVPPLLAARATSVDVSTPSAAADEASEIHDMPRKQAA